ncbi:MAG: 16S rRNA methyltransferase [Thermoplasmatota archaeon]
MLTLVLADAELELVPPELRAHPAVTRPLERAGRRGGAVVLDASLHHDALRHVPEGDRRGRPDLAHLFLLLGLDHPLNRRGGLRLMIHTRNDDLITVEPATRIMRNYDRFLGLMEKVLAGVPPPPGAPKLLSLERGRALGAALDAHARGPRAVLTESGRRVASRAWLAERHAASPDLTLILGGFPKGDFRSPVGALASETVSFHDEALSVWTVESEVLVHWDELTRDERATTMSGSA